MISRAGWSVTTSQRVSPYFQSRRPGLPTTSKPARGQDHLRSFHRSRARILALGVCFDISLTQDTSRSTLVEADKTIGAMTYESLSRCYPRIGEKKYLIHLVVYQAGIPLSYLEIRTALLEGHL
jgi:hypothetical protein